jgi:Transposase DDE domain
MCKSTASPAPGPLAVGPATLHDALRWAVHDGLFASVRLGRNTGWIAAELVWLALVWVFSDDKTLTGAFQEAHRWVVAVLGHAPIDTFQGLLKALLTHTPVLMPLLWTHFHSLMQLHGGSHWRIGRWLPLAIDGSRVSTPRTLDNEKAFCAPNFGHSRTARWRKRKSKGKGKGMGQGTARKKGKGTGTRRRKKKAAPVKPQIWLTLLWHMGLRMPWSWKSGPSNASERDHFKEMLTEQKFPTDTLFCGDAGFTGYELWKTIMDKGHSFLIRVGSNVRLIRKLGYVRESADLVYCWPDKAARSQQPPLVLRLLCVQTGKCRMWLLTNVLDEKELNAEQAVALYRLRWGVELQFRSVKQTFGRRKLRSRSPERAVVELNWSLLGLWLIQLFAVKEQVQIGKLPQDCSVSLALAVIRTMVHCPAGVPGEAGLAEQLRVATLDEYRRTRPKKARYNPDYKDKPAAGEPVVQDATKEQKCLLQQYLHAEEDKRLAQEQLQPVA